MDTCRSNAVDCLCAIHHRIKSEWGKDADASAAAGMNGWEDRVDGAIGSQIWGYKRVLSHLILIWQSQFLSSRPTFLEGTEICTVLACEGGVGAISKWYSLGHVLWTWCIYLSIGRSIHLSYPCIRLSFDPSISPSICLLILICSYLNMIWRNRLLSDAISPYLILPLYLPSYLPIIFHAYGRGGHGSSLVIGNSPRGSNYGQWTTWFPADLFQVVNFRNWFGCICYPPRN